MAQSTCIYTYTSFYNSQCPKFYMKCSCITSSFIYAHCNDYFRHLHVLQLRDWPVGQNRAALGNVNSVSDLLPLDLELVDLDLELVDLDLERDLLRDLRGDLLPLLRDFLLFFVERDVPLLLFPDFDVPDLVPVLESDSSSSTSSAAGSTHSHSHLQLSLFSFCSSLLQWFHPSVHSHLQVEGMNT